MEEEKTLPHTERYDKVLTLALRKAGELDEDCASTEHLLLGLLNMPGCVALQVLDELKVDRAIICQETLRRMTKGDKRRYSEVSWRPRALRIFYLANDEAKILNNDYLGTEHLLLALIREMDGVAGRILYKFNAKLDSTRTITKHIQGPT